MWQFYVVPLNQIEGHISLGRCEHSLLSPALLWFSKGAHLMVCNRSWHLPGNRKLVWHPTRLITELGCVNLSMDTLHLSYTLVLFWSEGSTLTPTLVLLSPRINMLCHCSPTMTKDHFLLISYGTKWPLCVDVPLNTYSFIQSVDSRCWFVNRCHIWSCRSTPCRSYILPLKFNSTVWCTSIIDITIIFCGHIGAWLTATFKM